MHYLFTRPLFLLIPLIAFVLPAQAQDILIGTLNDRSGAMAPIGKEHARLQQSFVAWINAQGGIQSGRKIRLLEGDSGCTDTDVVRNGARLAAEPALRIVLGPTCRAALEAFHHQIADPANLLIVNATVAAESIGHLPEREYLLRFQAPYALLPDQAAEWLARKTHRRIALVAADDPFSVSLANRVERSLRLKGIGSFLSTESDDLVTDASEAVMIIGSSGSAIERIAESNAWDDVTLPRYILLAEPAAAADGSAFRLPASFAGTTLLAHPRTDLQAYQAFVTWADAHDVSAATPFAAVLFDSMFAMALALESINSSRPDRLLTAISDVTSDEGVVILPGDWNKAKASLAAGAQISYHAASGRVEFDAYGDRYRPLIISVLAENGDWQVIENDN